MTKETEELLQHEDENVQKFYKSWFLDYASYVILERAVPAVEDGLKPVQRRIMHAMKEMDDGRYNKVANIIGQTMQYHPHGDASIGDAMVGLGQKDLLIDCQGNWGDIRTGDGAAAPRYIEARLSKFAQDVVFNPQTTEWQLSYDGRKREPVTLPVKFPLLLAQGVEGIAVGLSTKIMPHNFCELLEGCISLLKNKKVTLYPDFATGGMIDVSDYNQGLRGGKVRVRAIIEEVDKKTLAIRDIPYGTTTNNLIESIVKANDKGKIKIKKVIDNTAKEVEILIHLTPGQSPQITTDALYAFTDCEVSISPNACVVIDDRPHFVNVIDLLSYSNDQTVTLLTRELEIRRHELMEKILFASLEKIFIENRIYRDIEEAETWEEVLNRIDKGLEPFKSEFYRDITQDDLVRLTEIKIKRISRFDSFKADEQMKKLQAELEEVLHNLEHITEYTISYYKNLLNKYGKGKERKTLIKPFDTIAANVVAANNAKLYVNRKDGFIGHGLKKDEFVTDCSDIDDIIVFRADGKCMVSRIADKVFVGKDIIYVDVFKKNDERKVYNLVYVDGKTGRAMGKRFQVLAITRDKEYDLTKGNADSKTLYFTANANAEAEVITVYLTARSKARIKNFDFDFSTLEIKGRNAQGNILTRYPIRKIELKKQGESTLGGIDIWYDDITGKLNTDKRGKKLGTFEGEDQLLAVYKDGSYELTNYELTNRYEPDHTVLLEKFDPERVISSVYYDGNNKQHYVKRFKIETSTPDKRFSFITDARSSRMEVITTDPHPQVLVKVSLKENKTEEKYFDLDMVVDVKGWKAIGNKLTNNKVKKITLIQNEVQLRADKEKEEEEKKHSQTRNNGQAEKESQNDPNNRQEKRKTPIQSVAHDIHTSGDQVEWSFKAKSDQGEGETSEGQLGLF